MKSIAWTLLAVLLLGGCSSNDNLPLGVQAAFVAEHPYAKIDQSKKISDPAGNDRYIITYANPDGSKAGAAYGSGGEAESY